jgi:hypothetical protein
MSLAFTTLLLSAILGTTHPGPNAWPGTQDAGKKAQSNTTQTNESKPPEQQPSVPQEQQTKPADQFPSQQVPEQPPTQPEAKPPDQAPQVPASSPNENPTPAQPVESKPEVAPPEKKPEAAAAATPGTKKSRKKKARKKTTGQSSKPKKVIVRNGGTAETISQLAPDMSTSEASHARDTTNQILSSTEANLQRASTRHLNQDQLATVEQIRMFMGQSNAAVKAGDLQRGHNLAMKALLLSNDLVKQ